MFTCSASSPGRQLKDSSSSRCFPFPSLGRSIEIDKQQAAQLAAGGPHAPPELLEVRVFKRHPRHRAGFFFSFVGNRSPDDRERLVMGIRGRQLASDQDESENKVNNQHIRTSSYFFGLLPYVRCISRARLPVNRAPKDTEFGQS